MSSKNTGKKPRIALVGHEPGIGELAARLIGLRHPIEFKKGAVCRIDVDALPPTAPGALRWLLPPKVLRYDQTLIADDFQCSGCRIQIAVRDRTQNPGTSTRTQNLEPKTGARSQARRKSACHSLICALIAF